jgi:hypothetical protein
MLCPRTTGPTCLTGRAEQRFNPLTHSHTQMADRLAEALALADRAVKADAEAATDKAMAGSAATLYRHVAAMLVELRRSEADHERIVQIDEVARAYVRRAEELAPLGSAEAAGARAAFLAPWNTRALLAACSNKEAHPVAQQLFRAHKGDALDWVLLASVQRPPLPQYRGLRPLHAIEVFARTTQAPGCLISDTLFVSADLWSPSAPVPVHAAESKAASLQSLARALRLLSTSIAPLSMATADQVHTSFARACAACLRGFLDLASVSKAAAVHGAADESLDARAQLARVAESFSSKGAVDSLVISPSDEADLLHVAVDEAVELDDGWDMASLAEAEPSVEEGSDGASVRSGSKVSDRPAQSQLLNNVGKTLKGLGDRVRASAAAAADAVSTALAAGSSPSAMGSYGRAVRALAASTELLGIWLEAALCGGRLRDVSGARMPLRRPADQVPPFLPDMSPPVTDGWSLVRGRAEEDTLYWEWGAHAKRALAREREQVEVILGTLMSAVLPVVAADVQALLRHRVRVECASWVK